jgi:hypothetical protein
MSRFNLRPMTEAEMTEINEHQSLLNDELSEGTCIFCRDRQGLASEEPRRDQLEFVHCENCGFEIEWDPNTGDYVSGMAPIGKPLTPEEHGNPHLDG